ncbi:MAG: DUF4382 domain-containing protein [Polyangiaceae bacterium]|nr:DUF4382 domain-containing protein [Polyangiaceae bacterium]
MNINLGPIIATLAIGSLAACQAPGGRGAAEGTVAFEVVGGLSPTFAARPEVGDQLLVTIDELSVHVAPQDVPQAPATGAPAVTWVTAFAGQELIDLFDVRASHTFLAEAVLPAGRVTQVRLRLGDAPTLVVDGLAQAVRCPSCDETGIKVVPTGDLEVSEAGHLDLLLDFHGSLVESDGSGGYLLVPVLHVDVGS